MSHLEKPRKTPQSSEECFATAMEAHLSNLDPNMRITTGVVSVTRRSLRPHIGSMPLPG